MNLTQLGIAMVIQGLLLTSANAQSTQNRSDSLKLQTSNPSATPLSANNTPSASSAEVRTMRIGNLEFHVPVSYLDTWDGFQSKMGYIRIKALLPCLEPKTPENAAEFEKHHLGDTIVISIDRIGPSELTGDAHLAMRLAQAESYHRYVDDGVTAVRHHHASPGFVVFDDPALFVGEIFLLEGSKPAFFFECSRSDAPNFFPFPSCAVRELVHSKLLVQYWYSRTWIDNDLKTGLTIDSNVRKLIDRFTSPEFLQNPPTRGVCQ
ncbi:hypothetical protein [Rhodopila sp.]|uniref:hypothetical protein n=1 Tax=Rhodopila sp. TaxID=2480087 RepID=UPI002C83EB5B|nr:hypothetical protein [Rhodopila sp.]HVZ08373.1 hypothetical protein [Rhodopila sp.]